MKKFKFVCITIALGIYLFIIMSIMYLVKVNAVNIGGYIESNCSNQKCQIIKWNNRLIMLADF